jgi:hypothetical protein
LHKRDLILLEKIKDFFGVGTIHIRNTRNIAVYSVQSFEDLTNTIIPHFDKYPLLTQKQGDFLLFKSAMALLNAKEQSTSRGLSNIINIKASMNKPMSSVLSKAFPKTVPIKRPIIKSEFIPDPN